MDPGAGAGTGVDVGARAAGPRGRMLVRPGPRGRVGHVPAPLFRSPAGTGLLATGRTTGTAPGQAWLAPGPGPRGAGSPVVRMAATQPTGVRPQGPGLTSGCRPVLVRSGLPGTRTGEAEMPDDPGAPPPSPRSRVTLPVGATHRRRPVPGTGGTGAAGRSRDGSYRNQARLPAGQHGSYQGTRQGTRHRSPHQKAGAPGPAGALPVAPWTWRPPLVVRQENHDLAVSPVDLASAGTLGASAAGPSGAAHRAGLPSELVRGMVRDGPRATSLFGSRGQAGPTGRSSGRSPD